MSVFDHYNREFFKGPVFGGTKNGGVLIHTAPIYNVPVIEKLPLHRVIYDQKEVMDLTTTVQTYMYSQHGFWYLDEIGEDKALSLFARGVDVEAWADDDA